MAELESYVVIVRIDTQESKELFFTAPKTKVEAEEAAEFYNRQNSQWPTYQAATIMPYVDASRIFHSCKELKINTL